MEHGVAERSTQAAAGKEEAVITWEHTPRFPQQRLLAGQNRTSFTSIEEAERNLDAEEGMGF